MLTNWNLSKNLKKKNVVSRTSDNSLLWKSIYAFNAHHCLGHLCPFNYGHWLSSVTIMDWQVFIPCVLFPNLNLGNWCLAGILLSEDVQLGF